MSRQYLLIAALTSGALATGCATPRAPVGTTYTPTFEDQADRQVDIAQQRRTLENVLRADIGVSREGFDEWLSRNSGNGNVQEALRANSADGLYKVIDRTVGIAELGHALDCGERGQLPVELTSYNIGDDVKAAVAFNYINGFDTNPQGNPEIRLERVRNAGYRVESCLSVRDEEIATAVRDSWNSYILGVGTGILIGYNIPKGGGSDGGGAFGNGGNTNTGGGATF